ncbi:DNA polymerase [Paramuricea clavata]|uniref:DNA-directed DNA polymerase n=1 Tax=Paramuricea clavata TaxID=317549 RepID=A0A6S7H0U6_PARCT|nr:DNA polymerase [Paramuricea clavata]
MALRKFPEALGIPNICKGFHPYLFYDLNYVGPMVGLEYFDLPAEGSKERSKFDTWYNEQKEKTYVFKEAMYYYCRLDVDILRQGCIIFALLIKKNPNVFPFYDKTCHTIAGLELKVYRTNFLNEDTIGQIPAQGYGGNVNQSTVALYWVRELENDGVTLYSKLSPNAESKIMGRYVDGYCSETNTIYQFHGCFFHGCKTCYDSDKFNMVLSESFYTLRERTRCIMEEFKSNREVYEIYNYAHREKFFHTYVNTFVKLKQESSGVPKNCHDAEGKVNNEKLNEYVAEYFKHEGVKLDADKISYNPGQRTVMKALLNSLWGKLAQNEDTTVVSFLDRFDDLLELVNDNSIEVTSLHFISDNIARTTHRKIASLVTLPNRNVVIASFVTAYARLELFKVLHKLDDSMLYYDTDSVIYIEGVEKGHVLQRGRDLKCCTIPFQHPFMMTLCGPSQSGKSYFIEKIIRNHETLIHPTIDKLLYLYTMDKYDGIKQYIRDNKQTSTLKTFEFIDCNKGIPSMETIKGKLGKNTLLVLDDLMVGKLRNWRVNSHYHVMCKSLTDFRDVEMVAANKKICQSKLHKVLEDIGKKQYRYIVFDGCPKGYANTHVRTGIFPKDETVIYDL